MSAYRVHGNGAFSTRSLENLWLFHEHGYRRFALFMGIRYWVLFSRAVIGFSRYVLLAHKRGISPKLKFKTKLIFIAHLLAAGLIFIITKPMDKFIKGFGLMPSRDRLIRFIRARLASAYQRVLSLLPVPLIRGYLAVESKVPFIRSFRLRCKQLFQHI